MSPLSKKHADKINSYWTYRQDGSLDFIHLLIELSPNIGAFDSSGNLVAWCLRLQTGLLGFLQVDDDHLRQGLGLLVCKALTKKLGEMGLDVCACVALDNVASVRLFERIGFTLIEPVFWTRCSSYPTIGQ